METNCFCTSITMTKWQQRFQVHYSQMKDKFIVFRKLKQEGYLTGEFQQLILAVIIIDKISL